MIHEVLAIRHVHFEDLGSLELVLGERGGPPGEVPFNSLWGRRMANLGVLGACGPRLRSM